MSWRIAVRHSSTYRYSSPVVASFNEARLTPTASRRQVVLETEITTRPAVPLDRYLDYWSTVVHAFDVHESHSELTVTGSAVVETAPAPTLLPTTRWDDLRVPGLVDGFSELLMSTPYTPTDDEITEVARSLADGTTSRSCILPDQLRVRATCPHARDSPRGDWNCRYRFFGSLRQPK